MAHRPTFVNKGAFASGIAAITPGLPADLRNNDLMILIVESANQVIATPTNWTEAPSSPQSLGTAAAAGGLRAAVFYKWVLGVEVAPSVADTGNHTTGIITAYRGVNMANPFNANIGTTQAATTAMSAPGVTTTIDDCLIFMGIGLDEDIAGVDRHGAPANAGLSGIVRRHDQTVIAGVGGGVAVWTGYRDVAGATGNTTATATASTVHVYITLALEPIDPLVFTTGQYDNDEVTVIGVGANTNDGTASATPVLLRTEYSQGNPLNETATLNVEVDDLATAFSNTASNTRTVKQKTGDVRSNRRGGTMVYDDVNKRLIFFGGFDGTTRFNDVWEQYTDVPGQPWRKVTTTGTAPTGRNMAGNCIVKGNLTTGGAVRSYLIIWGGSDPSDKNDMLALRIDTPGSEAWTTITQTGAPAVRSYTSRSLVSTPVSGATDQNNIYLFSGWGAARLNDLQRCTFDVDTPTAVTWTVLRADGNTTGPTRRSGVILDYKASTHKLYSFGGFDGTTYQKELWEYDITGDVWTSTAPTGTAPLGREMGAGGFDATNNRFWYAGGWDGTAGTTTMNDIGYVNDVGGAESYVEVRAMSRAASTAGGDHSYPPNALSANCMLTDRGLLVQHGMFTYDSTERYLFAIDLNDGVTSDKPVYGMADGEYYTARDAASSLFNPVHNEWLIVAGFDDMDDDTTIARGTHSSDVWVYDPVNSRWKYSNKNFLSTPPSEGRFVAYDTTRNRVLLFGGLSGVDQLGNEIWSLERDANGLYTAKRLNPTGTPPSPRWLGAAAYDATNDRMIVTMGRNVTTIYNDAYALSFSGSADGAWSTLSPTGTAPVAAWQPAFFNKTSNNRLYVFGGATNTADSAFSAQLLYLDYTTAVPVWNTPTSSGATARRGAGFALDTTNDKLLIFGGWNAAVLEALQWWDVAAGGAWVIPVIAGSKPAGRRSLGGMFYNGKFYITAGRPGTGQWYSDTWELTPNYATPNSSTWALKTTRIFNTAYVKFITGILNTGYHWQSWLNETTGESIKNAFAGNLETAADFIIGVLGQSWNSTVKIANKFVGPMALRMQFKQPYASYRSASSNAYAQALAADLSFVGDDVLSTNKVLSGALSFTGALSRVIARVLGGVISFSGSFIKRAQKAFDGAMSFTGSLVRRISKSLSGVLSFTGVIVKVIGHVMTAALSFVGSLARRVGKVLSAVLSFTGTISRVINHAFTAALSFSGNLTRLIGRSLTAALSFVGNIVKSIAKPVVAALSFSGNLVQRLIFNRAFAGALSFAGSFTKQSNKSLTGNLSFVGSLTRVITRSFTAALNFVGNLVRQIAHAFTASLSFSGFLLKRVDRTFTGTLSFVGSLSRSISHVLTATLSFTGGLIKRLSRTLTGAALSFTGGLVKTSNKALTGSLSFVGSLIRIVNKNLTATLSFIGDLTRRISRSLTASLSFIGSLVKSTVKAVGGALSFVGSLLTASFFNKILTATVNFTGAITKRTDKSLSGGLSFIGTISKAISRVFSSALSFIGSLVRRSNRAMTASVSFVGSLVTGSVFIRALSATLNMSGNINRRVGRNLTGDLSFVGSISKAVSKTLSASLSFVGLIGKQIRSTMSSSLSFVGNLISGSFYSRALTATLNFSGSISKRTNKGLSGTVSFIGGISKSISKAVGSTLSFVGSIIKRMSKTVTATLSFVGSLVTVFIPGGALFTQNLTGALSFVGSISKKTNRNLGSSLTFLGSLTKAIVRLLTANLSFIGSFTKSINKSLSAVLSFTASLIGFFVAGVIKLTSKLILSRRRDATVIRPRETITTLSIETPRTNVLNNKDDKTILK